MTTERHVRINDLPHSGSYEVQVRFSQTVTVTLIYGTEISLGDRAAQNHPAIREHITGCLAEQETQGVAVNTSSGI